MRFIFAAATVMAMLLDLPCRGAEPAIASAESAGALGHAFALHDTTGAIRSLAEWQGKKAVVLLFLAMECPVSNFYSPELSRIATTFADRGVLVYGVHCDQGVTAAEAAQHAKEFGLKFPVLLDPEQKLAAAVGARVTPEAFVLNAGGKVVYRGRIDDRYSISGKRRDEPTRHDLEDALGAVLAGKTPEVAENEGLWLSASHAATGSVTNLQQI